MKTAPWLQTCRSFFSSATAACVYTRHSAGRFFTRVNLLLLEQMFHQLLLQPHQNQRLTSTDVHQILAVDFFEDVWGLVCSAYGHPLQGYCKPITPLSRATSQAPFSFQPMPSRLKREKKKIASHRLYVSPKQNPQRWHWPKNSASLQICAVPRCGLPSVLPYTLMRAALRPAGRLSSLLY